tara:strand:- start:558 stop:1691 length:1134 start_codon:yes stop_codon:yes gene_type:complete
MKKNIILTIFVLFLVEFFSFLASYYQLLIFNNEPYFYNETKVYNINKYWTEKDLWGSWHKKNIIVQHKKSCFDVEYKTNEIGARDESFLNLQNKKNLILLGDSFAEGFGVSKENMFEKIIEAKTDFNILNFASSRDFGILQYYLIYEKLAKNYNHDGIIISLLVNNDFKDNDLSYFEKYNLDKFNGKKRFRPYFKKNKNKFEIIYPENSQKFDEEKYNFVKKYFWFSNVLRTIKYIYISKKIKSENKILNNDIKNSSTEHITDYFYTPIYQQEAGIFFLKKIILNNIDKKIYLFSIPLYEDYLAIKENDIRKEIYWWKKLKALDKKYNNFYFFDLHDYANNNYKEYFFPNKCDGHWNNSGHEWAGKILSELILKSSN